MKINNSLSKRHRLWGLVFVGIGVLSLVILESKMVNHKHSIATSPTVVKNVSVLGESTSPQYSLSIDNVLEGQQNIDQGTRRVTLTVTVHNNSKELLQISPGLQMFLADSYGGINQVTARYLEPDSPIGGPLADGSAQSYVVDFDIPLTTSPTEFSFQPSASVKSLSVRL